MHKVMGALIALVGLLAVAAGVAGIYVVGSDNVLGSSPHVVYGNSQVAVSAPRLLAFTGGTAVVTAENPAGRVFLGVAHPVDVANLTSGVTTYAISAASRAGLSGALLETRTAAPAVDPTRLSIWTASATGTGTQSLSIPLDGSVKQLYVGPVGKGGPLTMSVGTTIDNAYAGSLAAIVVGVLLLLLGLFLLLGRGRPSGSPARAPQGASGSPSATPVVGAADGDVVQAPARSERRAWVVSARLVLLGLPVAVVSGCAVSPTPVPAWDPKTVTKPALTVPAAAAMWNTYDASNNAALKVAAAPTYNAKAWDAVDTDAVLLADRYLTARNELAHDGAKPSARTHTPVALYSSSAHAYPLLAILASANTSSAPKAVNDAKTVQLSVMRKDSVAAPWRMAASAAGPRAGLPVALAPGAGTPTGADLKRAAGVASTLGSYLSSHSVSGLTVDANLAGWRSSIEDLVKKGSGVSGTVVPSLYPDSSQVSGSPHAPQVVRVKGGLLMVTSHRAIGTFHTTNGAWLSIHDTYQAKLTGQEGPLENVVYSWLVTVATFMPDKGSAKVVGSSFAFTI